MSWEPEIWAVIWCCFVRQACWESYQALYDVVYPLQSYMSHCIVWRCGFWIFYPQTWKMRASRAAGFCAILSPMLLPGTPGQGGQTQAPFLTQHEESQVMYRTKGQNLRTLWSGHSFWRKGLWSWYPYQRSFVDSFVDTCIYTLM